MIVVEHVLSVLPAMVSRLVVLHNAKRLADGTPSEIVHDPEVSRLISAQQKALR